jgi:2-methylcitrate dehydratase PrpD
LFLKKYLDNLHLDIEVIKEIKVETYQIASEHDNFNPTNMEELKQSLPLAIAIALVCNEPGLDVIEELIDCGLFEEADNFISLDERSIEVRKIRDVLSRITIYYNNVLDDMTPDKRPSKVSFILDESFDKDVLTHTTMYPLGESENPLDYDDILEKFKSLNPHYDLERLKIIEDMEYFSLNNIFSTIGLI